MLPVGDAYQLVFQGKVVVFLGEPRATRERSQLTCVRTYFYLESVFCVRTLCALVLQGRSCFTIRLLLVWCGLSKT